MESKTKDFWLIVIQEKEVVVSLVSHSPDGIQLRGTGDRQNWSGDDEKELLSAVDISLTTCSETCHLDSKEEPDDIALILSPFWVDENGQIIGHKASLLKKLCQQFEFNPLGFMVDDEALADSTDQKTDLSNSFILVHLSASEFRLSLVHLGKIKARAKYSYADNLSPQELEDAISSLKTNITLPPQIVFWGKTGSTLEDQMLNHSWTGKHSGLSFLHFPEIKILEDQEVFSTFSQIITREMTQIPASPNQNSPNPPQDQKDKVEDKPQDETNPQPQTPPDPPPVLEPSLPSEESNFGFVPADIASQIQADFQSEPQVPLPDPRPSPTVSQPELLEKQTPSPSTKKFRLPSFPKLKLPRFSLPPFVKKRTALFLGISLSALFLALLFSWYYFPKAVIGLYVKPEPVEFSTQDATFDPAAEKLDVDQLVIPVKELSFSTEKSQEQPTTGEKSIGEKAKGEVKIQNRTDERVDLPKGTVISSEGGLSFYLTSEISIASKTPDFESGLDHWGETKAMVEAAQIGSEYNLAQSTRFSIDDYSESSFVVTSTESFTGGYSQTVQSVSSQDQQDLKATLLSQLDQELEDILDKKVSPPDLLLKNSIKTELQDIEYSREIGEEAENLSATATVQITAYLLEESTQKEIIDQLLDPTLSADLTVKADSVEVSVSEDDQITIVAAAIPLIDTSQLIQEILGLGEQKAFSLLQGLPRVYRYTLDYQPPLPSFIRTLPHQADNIRVEINY
jgi:hypothetical protein